MLNWKRLDFQARTIAVHPEGKILAVGCTNGTILIIDASTLLISLSFKDRDQCITAIKFSPDNGEKLALAYGMPNCEIMVYDTKSFK
jgi:WD40 repeat protein